MIKNVKATIKDYIPLAVGFGISKPEQVKSIIYSGADAAIVGSRFVNIIQENQNKKKMLEKLSNIAAILKAATKR